jgi:hypothetical protein
MKNPFLRTAGQGLGLGRPTHRGYYNPIRAQLRCQINSCLISYRQEKILQFPSPFPAGRKTILPKRRFFDFYALFVHPDVGPNVVRPWRSVAGIGPAVPRAYWGVRDCNSTVRPLFSQVNRFRVHFRRLPAPHVGPCPPHTTPPIYATLVYKLINIQNEMRL